jgi:hypothetical protein
MTTDCHRRGHGCRGAATFHVGATAVHESFPRGGRPASATYRRHRSILDADRKGTVFRHAQAENADVIKVVENPLASAQPTILCRAEIASRQQSKTSMMPKGLLDKLTRDEVLDLLAYVAAGGKRQNVRFERNEHTHGHAHAN